MNQTGHCADRPTKMSLGAARVNMLPRGSIAIDSPCYCIYNIPTKTLATQLYALMHGALYR